MPRPGRKPFPPPSWPFPTLRICRNANPNPSQAAWDVFCTPNTTALSTRSLKMPWIAIHCIGEPRTRQPSPLCAEKTKVAIFNRVSVGVIGRLQQQASNGLPYLEISQKQQFQVPSFCSPIPNGKLLTSAPERGKWNFRSSGKRLLPLSPVSPARAPSAFIPPLSLLSTFI